MHDIGLATWFDGSLMVRHGLNGAANQVQDRTGLPSPGRGSPAPTGPGTGRQPHRGPRGWGSDPAPAHRSPPSPVAYAYADREQPAGSRRNRRTRPAGHDPQTRPDCDDRIEHTAADQHLWEALNRARADCARVLAAAEDAGPGPGPATRTVDPLEADQAAEVGLAQAVLAWR